MIACVCSNEEMYRTVMQAGVHACISTQGDTDKTNILVHTHIGMWPQTLPHSHEQVNRYRYIPVYTQTYTYIYVCTWICMHTCRLYMFTNTALLLGCGIAEFPLNILATVMEG